MDWMELQAWACSCLLHQMWPDFQPHAARFHTFAFLIPTWWIFPHAHFLKPYDMHRRHKDVSKTCFLYLWSRSIIAVKYFVGSGECRQVVIENNIGVLRLCWQKQHCQIKPASIFHHVLSRFKPMERHWLSRRYSCSHVGTAISWGNHHVTTISLTAVQPEVMSLNCVMV